MSLNIPAIPTIVSCNWLDNENDDLELISISCANSATVYPSYIKLIIDNVSNATNSLSQKVINLKNDDYTYNNGSYLINVPIPVIANKSYTIKAKVFYSDTTSTPYSNLKAFTSGPTTPVIISGFGDALTSIFLSIQPQMEVVNYSAILAYKDYSNNQQLDVIDNIVTTDNTKQFLKLTNLLQNIDYSINLIASNANGQSQISNSIVSSTKPQPDPITNLVVICEPDSTLVVSWNPPLNSVHLPVTKYRVVSNWSQYFIDGSLTTFTYYIDGINLRHGYTISAIHSDVNDKNKDSIVDYESTPVYAFVDVPEPSEVRNLTALINPSTLAISLSWDPPANNNILTTYSYDIKFNGEFYQNITTNSLVYTQTVPNGVYPFEIIPLHKQFRSSQKKSINVQIPTTGAPVNLTSSYDASCNIVLNWSPPTNNNAIVVSSYNIHDASDVLIVSTTDLTYTFQNQIPGQSYTYTIKSLYGSYVGSGASTTVSIPVPAPAVGFSSSFDSTGSISLTWNYPQTTMINIDNFAIFDIYNNTLSPSIPASPSNSSYFFIMGNTYPLGASYSFYILSYNKGIPSIASMQTTVSLPIPSAPLNFSVVNNPTIPPNASLTWLPGSNNNVISSDSYNIYQDGVLITNVISSTYNTAALVAGQTYSFIVKPLHGVVEFDSPSIVSLTAFQQSSQPTNFIGQPKNNTVIVSWNNPTNTGGLTPYQYNLSYIDDNGNVIQSNIAYSSSGTYSQSITGLVNKSSHNFTLYLITGGTNGISPLNGQSVTLTASASGSPIIQSILFSNKTLSSTVDGNGSNLISNYIIISYDSSNVPTVNQFTTPIANASGIYNISQILPSNAVKASLVVANAAGISSANSF